MDKEQTSTRVVVYTVHSTHGSSTLMGQLEVRASSSKHKIVYVQVCSSQTSKSKMIQIPCKQARPTILELKRQVSLGYLETICEHGKG